jgi:hypothetical protein
MLFVYNQETRKAKLKNKKILHWKIDKIGDKEEPHVKKNIKIEK